jgi:hypothetical protein
VTFTARVTTSLHAHQSRRCKVLVEGRRQRCHGGVSGCVVAVEPPNGGTPIAVGALQRSGCRFVQEDTRPVSRNEGVGMTQLAKVLERRERRL